MALIDSTLLELTGEAFQLNEFAARGIIMTMAPIDSSASIRRDINGNAVNMSAPQFRKYKFTLTCDDMEAPGFSAFDSVEDGLWPGDVLEMKCIPQLGHVEAQTFDVMVSSPWSVQSDEWGAAVSWSLELEQV